MSRKMLRLALSGWRARWLSTALTFVLVALGATALMLALHLRDVAERPWQRTFAATNGAHVVAFGPSRDVERLAQVDGVAEAVGPVPHVVTSLQIGPSTYGLRAVGTAADPPPVERPVVTDGRWLSGDGELVLERSFARVLGVRPGDVVDVRRTDGTATLRVVGVAVLAREAPYPDNQPAEGYVTNADLTRIQPNDTRWSWVEAIRLENPAAASAAAREAFGLLPEGTFVRTYDQRLADASERHRTTTIVLRTFSIVLLIAVGLVLATLVSARVLDRAAELGLLKAVGFTPAQVSLVVAAEQLLVALVAGVAGAVAGSWLTPMLVRRSSELLGTVPTTVSAGRVAFTVVAVVLVVAAASTVPTARLARGGVLRSLASQHGGGAANRLARRVPLRNPIPVAFGVKETVARPSRSAATAVALALTVGSLVAGLAFEATVANEDAAEQTAQVARPRPADPDGLIPARPDPVAIEDSTREQIRPIVHGFNAALLAVAVVNLLAASLLSLRRRRRDIGVTRAIGLTPRQVRWAIFCSDGLLGLLAAFIGIPLGTVMFFGVYRLVNGDTDLAVLPPLWQLALVPLVCVVAVVAVTAIPAHRATRLDIVGALRYE